MQSYWGKLGLVVIWVFMHMKTIFLIFTKLIHFFHQLIVTSSVQQWGNEEPYRSERKVENLQESHYILATCGKLICLYMVISEIVSSKFGYFGAFFSSRGISQIWLHLCMSCIGFFFCCQVIKICPLKKEKKKGCY